MIERCPSGCTTLLFSLRCLPISFLLTLEACQFVRHGTCLLCLLSLNALLFFGESLLLCLKRSLMGCQRFPNTQRLLPRGQCTDKPKNQYRQQDAAADAKHQARNGQPGSSPRRWRLNDIRHTEIERRFNALIFHRRLPV